MTRLREIPRTAAFAWSSDVAKPHVATGTRAGAVDADFSNETKLEIWSLHSAAAPGSDAKPVASISTESRFYDIAWSAPSGDHSEGVIATALENGSLELYDAAKLMKSASDALIARTTKHTGAIKCLQFNPHRPELLASAGAKGELYITDLNNPENPYRVGAAAARADDFDSLDWNKKVPHILVTGSTGGFVTVWDVKAKKESLTLNNYNRKPISAVAWNPDEPTKLATAIPSDQDPLILFWNLRNSAQPEKILKGHDQGVLSLAWCAQDSSLLLSCGKDNRNICWDANRGEALGEFPIVLNHAFQTRWNPVHPNLLATASYDGKIIIHNLQNTGKAGNDVSGAIAQAADASDFFASAQTAPQASSFNIPLAPKWMRRPVGVSFGFGGKVVTFSTPEGQPKGSTVKLSSFVSDSNVEASISGFQTDLQGSDVSKTCDSRIETAKTDASKEDWRVIQTLVSDSPRKQILSYLGFEDAAKQAEKADTDAAAEKEEVQANGEKKENRLSAFFDNAGESGNFLTDLAASKGARTNNPFHIYSGKETDAEKQITKALMLGQFEQAMDICLKENRLSDAFMIALCGGQKCIDKAQAAYFSRQSEGPNFARLLASVVGKNLWDVVYNADLDDWKEVMATLCTFADATEFPDLCEALGDRLDEDSSKRKNASFCYLAGSKLEKVVPIWIAEMQDAEQSRMSEARDESAFSIHVQSLQSFIEKVTIFRRATSYVDKAEKQGESDWKLSPLYSKYTEYADVVSAHGHLALADEYVGLLPDSYGPAETAKNRISQALKKPAAATVAASGRASKAPIPAAAAPLGGAPAQPAVNSYMPAAPFAATAPAPAANPYGAPANAYAPPTNSYAPAGAYAPSQPVINSGPPPAGSTATPPPKGGPPRAGLDKTNWNDLPEGMGARAPRSGRATPNPNPIATPFANAQAGYGTGPAGYGSPTKTSAPLPPPPKAGQAPPQNQSPLAGPPPAGSTTSPPPRPPSSAYAPQQGANSLPPPQTSLPQRTASPYQPPPAAGPSTSRYAPTAAPAGGPAAAPPMGTRPPIAPNPYMQQQQTPYAPTSNYAPNAQAAPPAASGPPPSGPPPAARGPPPPRAGSGPPPPASSRPPSQPSGPPAAAKHPAGDRSHIPSDHQPIFQTLHDEMQRVKGKAPANFKQAVDDTEKRLNILFDALNNESLPGHVAGQLKQLSSAIGARNHDAAQAVHTELIKGAEAGSAWSVGVKRLIQMSRATPV